MKHGRQFSVENPFPEIGGSGRIMIDIFGGGEYFIDVRGETIKFEWSEQFGPMALTQRGAERSLGPRHLFWRAASLWNLQGQRLDGSKALWHEPRKPVYETKHLGGGHYKIIKVIDPGEPGHDW